VGTLTPAAVWRITPALVLALDERLGPPVDSYVNGSQTWLTDDHPGDITLEWRLHPAAGHANPPGVSHYDVWDAVVGQLSTDAASHDVLLGEEARSLLGVWDGLECFPAYGDEVEPAVLAGAARDAIGIAPDAAGLVDHGRIGAAWERAPGSVSIMTLLLEDLEAR
jgi:hypothetical protein